MRKFILVFNPRDNTRNSHRLNLDCFHIEECLSKSATQFGTGAKAIRKALQGVKRLADFNADWFLYFNFSSDINPNRKRPLAIQVTKHHSALFWSQVMNALINQLGLNKALIEKYAEEFRKVNE